MASARQALQQAAVDLGAAGIDGASRDARWLLAWAMGIDRGVLAARLEESLTSESQTRFEQAILRRITREPVSHIMGEREFWGRMFKVTNDVLDPRPETELLVELALQEPFARFLDLGTGSGAIAVTILCERPTSRATATDISEKAALVAGENAARHGVADRITIPLADWFDDVGGQYDLILSNPPYIATEEMAALAPELAHEPRQALTDEADGLSAYRAIAARYHWCLRPGGRILVEIGVSQGAAASDIFKNAGLKDVMLHQDLSGKDRVVSARG